MTTSSRFLSRVGTAPWWVQLLPALLLGVLVHSLVHLSVPGGTDSWGQVLARGAVTGATVLGVVRLTVRMGGGAEASAAARRAVRRRAVPEDVDPDLLRRGLSSMRRGQLVLGWVVCVAALLLAGLVLLVGDPGDPVPWGVLGVVLAIAVAHPLLTRWWVRRADALLAELDRRQGTSSA